MPLDSLSFSGIDSLIANKYKSVEQLKAEKAAKLQNKLDTLGVTGTVLDQYDTDTYNVQLPDGTTQVVRAAGIDSPDSYFADNTAAQKKKLQQKYALNQITGIPVDQIQDSDLTAWKENVDAQSANQGFSAGSEITYIPTGTASKLKGDTRLIADIYNKNNQNLGDIFDTPETNAAYSAPWNRAERRATANQEILARNKLTAEFGENYKSGWDADGNAITVQQNDGWFTKGDVDGLTAAQVDYGTRQEKSNKNNWGTPDSLLNVGAGALAMLQDELLITPAYAIAAVLTGSTNLSTSLQARTNDWNSAPVNSLKPEITEADVKMFGEYNDRIKEYRNNPDTEVSPELVEFGNSEKMQILLGLDGEVQQNRRVYDASVNVGKDLRKQIYASNLDTHIKKNYDRIYNKDGVLAAGVWLMTNHPSHPVDKIVESLPIMYAALSGVGVVDMYSSRYMKAIEERRQETGEELTNKELNIARTSIAIAVAAERMGAEVLFNKVPGSDKLVTSLLLNYPKLSKALLPLARLGIVAGIEGGSEIITEVGEQYAVKQDFDKIEGSDLGYAGTIGAFGGASIKAPGEVVGVFKSNNKKLQQQADKISTKLDVPDTIPLTDEERADIGNKLNKLNIKLGELRKESDGTDDVQFMEDEEFRTDAGSIESADSYNSFIAKWTEKLGLTEEQVLNDYSFGELSGVQSTLNNINEDYDAIIKKNPEDTEFFEGKRKQAIVDLFAMHKESKDTVSKSQKQRSRLLNKQKELRAQLEAGKPNPGALSANAREKLTAQLDKLNERINTVVAPKEVTPQQEEVVPTINEVIAQADTVITTTTDESVSSMEKEEVFAAGKELTRVRKLLNESTAPEAEEKLKELAVAKTAISKRLNVLITNAESKTEESKDTILYSLNSIGNDSTKQNQIITDLLAQSDDVVTPAEKEVLNARKTVLQIGEELKTLNEVHKEVITGGGNKNSFDEHAATADTEKGFNDLETFVIRTTEKAQAFKQALNTALETGTSQYINKNFEISSEAPINVGTGWRVDPVGVNPLVEILQKEAEYGEKTLQLVLDTVALSSNRETSDVAKQNSVIQSILDDLDSVKDSTGTVEDIVNTKEERPTTNVEAKQRTADVINALNTPDTTQTTPEVGEATQTQSVEAETVTKETPPVKESKPKATQTKTKSSETVEPFQLKNILEANDYLRSIRELQDAEYQIGVKKADQKEIIDNLNNATTAEDIKDYTELYDDSVVEMEGALESVAALGGNIYDKAGYVLDAVMNSSDQSIVSLSKKEKDNIKRWTKSRYGIDAQDKATRKQILERLKQTKAVETTKTEAKEEVVVEPIKQEIEPDTVEIVALKKQIKQLEAEVGKLETTLEGESTPELTALETPLKTKAGFKKRFTNRGLFKNGRIVSFEEFSKLDENTIIAAAKTLKVCD